MKEHKEPKEKEGGSLKKRALCKGKRPHDWVQILPYGMEAIEGVYNGDPEPYYLAMAAIEEFEQHIYEELDKIGIRKTVRPFSTWFKDDLRPFKCSVCGKLDFQKKV